MDVQKMLEILKRDYGIESKEELIERFESSKGLRAITSWITTEYGSRITARWSVRSMMM